MVHPWIMARARDARDFIDASEIVAWRRKKMPDEVVTAILSDARPYSEIAAACNISYQMVAQIKTRRLYGHVPFEGSIPRGARATMSPETVRAVFLDSDTVLDSARKHGVSAAKVMQIRQRRTHGDITAGLVSPRAALRVLDTRHASERAEMSIRHANERAALFAKMSREEGT